MTSAAEPVLFYGTVGKLRYDKETKSWRSQRLHRDHQCLSYVGGDETHVHPSRPIRDTDDIKYARAREKAVLALLKNEPALAPAKSVVYELSKPSHAQENENGLDSPRPSKSLRACTVHDPQLQRSITLMAWIGGELGEKLVLSAALPCTRGWERDNSMSVESLELDEKDVITFDCDLGPIFDVDLICISNTSTCLVAVRYLHNIILFRFNIKSRPISNTLRDMYGQRSLVSRSELKKLLVLSSTLSPDKKVVDFALSPSDPPQIAFVDCAGHWCIWDISDSRDQPVRSTLLTEGEIVVAEESETSPDSNLNRWHQIFWVPDSSLFIVCNWQHVALFDIQGQSVQKSDLTFGVVEKDRAQTILDISRSSIVNGFLLVLTNSHIHLIRASPSMSLQNDPLKPILEVVASLAHFRHEFDTNLRILAYHDINDRAVLAFLYSKLNGLATEFQFTIDTYTSNRAYASFYDSRKIECPLLDNFSDNCKSAMLLPIPHISLHGGASPDVGLAIGQSGETFLQYFLLTSDLSLRSCMFKFDPRGQSQAMVGNEFDRKKRAMSTPQNLGGKDPSRFIVSDDEVEHSTQQGMLQLLQKRRKKSIWKNRVFAAERAVQHDAAVPQRITYETLVMPEEPAEVLKMSDLSPSSLNLQLRSASEIDNVKLDTLAALFSSSPRLDDIDLSDQAFQNVFHTRMIDSMGRSVVLDAVPAPPHIKSDISGPSHDTLSISDMYHNLIRDYLGPLPEYVPNIVRLNKEKRVRKLAVVSVLSQIRLQQPLQAAQSSMKDQAETLKDVVPESSRTDSLVDRILIHWAPGADPSAFDPIALVHQDSGAIPGSSMDPTQRLKVQKRIERQRLREQNREKRKRQRMGLEDDAVASQPVGGVPGIWTSSQPETQPEATSSQTRAAEPSTSQPQPEGRDVGPVASQILPGAYGGIQGLAMRKKSAIKKRKAGF